MLFCFRSFRLGRQLNNEHKKLGDVCPLDTFLIVKRIFLRKKKTYRLIYGLPWWLSGNESACNAGDMGLISGCRRSPGEGNGYPPQHSCLENPMDKESWWATIHGVTKESDSTE